MEILIFSPDQLCIDFSYDRREIFFGLNVFCLHVTLTNGELAEWSIAAVLKTVEPQGSRGSNPLLSASFWALRLFTIEGGR